MHACNLCSKVYTRKDGLTRHVLSVHEQRKFTCDQCEKTFKRNYSLTAHKQGAKCSRKRNSEAESSVSPKRRRVTPALLPPCEISNELLSFNLESYEPDTHETIRHNLRLIKPYTQTNRKIMDTFNISTVGYDTDKICALLEDIYRTQKWSYKVRIEKSLSIITHCTQFKLPYA